MNPDDHAQMRGLEYKTPGHQPGVHKLLGTELVFV